MTDQPLEAEFEDEYEEDEPAQPLPRGTVAAVVSATDWTTETIISQLKRGNIQLNPRFQRRDAWKRDRKSRFIESLIVGLPIPQIVLAESKDHRGKFIVLDGKQRLLSILQFWGLGEGENNAYSLSGLTLRRDLHRIDFQFLSTSSELEPDYNALCNESIRTVVIKNWSNTDFLHTVFLRLNTGSVNLSPQELRQALLPGPFSDYVDDAAAKSPGLRQLLGLTEPDPRMRDIEILARYLGFRFFARQYPGRMKAFLDDTFGAFNKRWNACKPQVEEAVEDFEAGVTDLIRLYGDRVARKPGSRQFNRAIFDGLIYFHSQAAVRQVLMRKTAQLKRAYDGLFRANSAFLKAVESDTAGTPNTSARLTIWAKTLSKIAGKTISAPRIAKPATKTQTRKKIARRRQ